VLGLVPVAGDAAPGTMTSRERREALVTAVAGERLAIVVRGGEGE
jgi:hypothetical protein